MCNPPFYVSDEEMQRLTAEKELPPHAVSFGISTNNTGFRKNKQWLTRSVTFMLLMRRDKSQTCTGAPNEMVTPGGEAAFVIRMIRESKQYAQQMS